MTNKYIIWSIDHGAWRGPACRGDVARRSEAGIYTLEKALAVTLAANDRLEDAPSEAIVPYVEMKAAEKEAEETEDSDDYDEKTKHAV